MLIKIKNRWPKQATIAQIRGHLIISARRYLLRVQLGSQDLTIQKMLKERTSERNLKAACISLLFKMDFSFADDDYVLVSFKTDEDERLAKLITYGDGKCMGSDILLRALS